MQVLPSSNKLIFSVDGNCYRKPKLKKWNVKPQLLYTQQNPNTQGSGDIAQNREEIILGNTLSHPEILRKIKVSRPDITGSCSFTNQHQAELEHCVIKNEGKTYFEEHLIPQTICNNYSYT